MLRFIAPTVMVFDLEWVPDPPAGRRVYNLGEDLPDEEVLKHMWQAAGATEDDPQPYLKTVLCRIVSVAAVIRSRDETGAVSLQLHSLPGTTDGAISEKELIRRFLDGVGRSGAQLVGFNSDNSDLPILLQRGLAHGISVPGFARRPEKPWEGRDYFARSSDWHLDLLSLVGGWGKATPSLHELASVAGIPGKMGTSGDNVVDLWRAGKIREVVEYNQYDALTTYLLWLRTAHFSGLVSTEQFRAEEEQLDALLRDLGATPEGAHLLPWLQRWRTWRPGTN
jgi:predicted PolB exonuclease-like 3'-5' exonuclease